MDKGVTFHPITPHQTIDKYSNKQRGEENEHSRQ